MKLAKAVANPTFVIVQEGQQQLATIVQQMEPPSVVDAPPVKLWWQASVHSVHREKPPLDSMHNVWPALSVNTKMKPVYEQRTAASRVLLASTATKINAL